MPSKWEGKKMRQKRRKKRGGRTAKVTFLRMTELRKLEQELGSVNGFFWYNLNLLVHKISAFTRICSGQIICRKVQTRRKSEAKMVNTALAPEVATPLKPGCKCSIYHFCHFALFCIIFALNKFERI